MAKFDLQSALSETDQALGLPPGFSRAQIQVESSFNPRAVSPAGAMGLAQVMPATLKVISERVGRKLDPYDPMDAVVIHREVMRENLGKFRDPAKAAMAYNGGWDASRWNNPETQAYVGKIRKAMGSGSMLTSIADKALSAVSGTAHAKGQNMPKIDPAQVKWDEDPSKAQQPTIDVAQVQWDDAPKAEGRSAVTDLGEGLFQGVGRTVGGAAQLVGKGISAVVDAVAPDSDYAKMLRRKSENLDRSLRDWTGEFDKGAGKTTAGKVGQFAGEVATSLPLGAVIPAAGGLAGRVAASGAAGAVAGASQPVLNGDFWQEKNKQAATSGAIGAAFPVVGTALRAAGRGVGSALGAGSVAPEVAQLARRAQEHGINIRADQLVNSKPMNVLSGSLDYVPLSGKGAAIDTQQKQFNTAISKTIGENTDNVAQAIKNAERRLGGEFDRVLKNTAVRADDAFQNDLARIVTDAQNEMTEQQFGVLTKQVNNILDKVKSGDVIDADAAYNIKKGLDRLSKSNDSTLAYYARDTRNALLDALNRSLPDGGKDFAKTRKQWSNLMELDRLVPRGAEGNISAARLANARNIRSDDLGELADIAGQFLKGRLGDSGTAQRAGVYSILGTGAYFDPVSVGLGLTAGRLANSALSSKAVTNRLISRSLAPLNSGGPGGSLQAPNNALLQRLTPYLSPAAAASLTSSLTEP